MKIFSHVHTFSDPFLKTEAEKLEATSKMYSNAGENKSPRRVHECILKKHHHHHQEILVAM